MIDHRGYAHNLGSCEIKAWKEIQAWTGFEPMTSALPVQCSTDWAIKPSGSWSREFVSSFAHFVSHFVSSQVEELLVANIKRT